MNQLLPPSAVRILGELRAVLHSPDGTVIEDLGVICRRCITTAGVNALFDVNTPIGITAFNYHESGTGTNAEAITDTALQAPAGPAAVAGTQSNPVAGTRRSVATITYTAQQTITEHVIKTAGNIVWDRSVFQGIGVLAGLQITFTHDSVAIAGG